jgi:hypothetical protein
METKLKIGILIRDIEKLRNFEYRIISGILDHPNLDLCLFIKDGRKETKSLSSKINQNLFSVKFLANMLYFVQHKIESFLFKNKKTIDKTDIINRVKKIETIFLNPTRKGFLDIFSDEDANIIKKYNLDIILRHEFNIIRGDILNSSKYGIWSYHHADNSINRGSPAGFWEIVNNEPYCGVTLQRLTPELDGGLIIDKAYFNWHWSFYKNNNNLLEKSVVLLFKNINKLLEDGHIETKKSLTYYNPLYRKPDSKVMLKYMLRFYFTIFDILVSKIFRIRTHCWTLFFKKGIFLESALYKIENIKMPSNVFWADPFLYYYNNNFYVFFENYSYKNKKGKISVGKIKNDRKGKYSIIDIMDVLDLDYHLSYPQIIEEDGALYLIPESCHNKRLEVYRCINFPDKWELYSTAFDGEDVADTTYFQDENNQRWLFLNKGYMHEAELYIYSIDSLKLNEIKGHKLNPIYIDCRKGRNGGAIFKWENTYYRPSQINIYGVYGRGLQISKIKKLTIDEYEEEPMVSIEPNFRKGLIGIHHLHQIEECFVFDGCYKKL